MDKFIPSQSLGRLHRPSGVEQLDRSAVDQFVVKKNVPQFRRQLENGLDEQTRSTLLKRLLHEAEKSCLTRRQLDRIDRHMADLRQLTYRQVELVEKDKLNGHNAERALKLLATLNDLMANYQTLRRRISPTG
jgi:reverse gyrase